MTWARGNRFFLAATLAIGVAAVAAGDTAVVYETTVTGFNQGSGRDVVVDADGNAYVLSMDRDDDGVHLGLAVVKLSPEGALLWVTPISGSDHDNAGADLPDQNVPHELLGALLR